MHDDEWHGTKRVVHGIRSASPASYLMLKFGVGTSGQAAQTARAL
jgi:hypothetical protein